MACLTCKPCEKNYSWVVLELAPKGYQEKQGDPEAEDFLKTLRDQAKEEPRATSWVSALEF